MSFNEGDFIVLEYTIRVKETGNIVDTTNEELAKKEGIYETGRLYGPTLIVLGKGWLNKYVEEKIKELDVGGEAEIEVPPEKAFGERDPSKVRVFSIREFRRRGYRVQVGDVVEVGGEKGIVKSVTGGRVIIDFNHPLAGKTLVYKIKIVRKLEETEEKIKGLARRYLQIPEEELKIEYDPGEKRVVIEIPTKYMARKDIQYAKILLVTDIYDMLKDEVDKVVFQEVFTRRKEEKAEKQERTEKKESEEKTEEEAKEEAVKEEKI